MRRVTGITGLVICLAAMPLAARESGGGRQGQPAVTRTFNHLQENRDTHFGITVPDGQPFKILIEDTCPESFNYEIRRIPRSAGGFRETAQGSCEVKNHPLEIVHDQRYGGYVIHITKKTVGSVTRPNTDADMNLEEVDLIISVETSGWRQDVYGGFTLSELTDPRFALVDREGEDGQFVIRDTAAEDEARLGLAGFIHLYHTKLPQLAGTFGLGVNEDSDATYYTGLSWRFGEKGALTAGYAWGSVDRLPPGTPFDSVVDPNLLTNLGTRVRGDLFFGLSYKLIDIGDLFKKPFAGKQPEGQPQVTQPPSPVPPPPPNAPPAPSAAPPRPPADSPTGFQAAIDGNRLTVLWDAIEGADRYELLDSTHGCGIDMLELLLTVGAEPNSLPILRLEVPSQELLAATHHFLAVRAVKDGEPGRLTDCKEVDVPHEE